MSQDNPKSTPRRRVALWLADRTGAAIIGALAGVVVVVGLAAIGLSQGDGSDPMENPPPLTSQWLRERAEIAREGLRIALNRRVDLRGIGEPSTVLVLRPPSKSCLNDTTVRSQQIRVYDVEEGLLHQALKFEPRTKGCPPLEFRFVQIAPLREYDDTSQVLGKFVGGIDGFPDEITIPVVISWKASLQRYVISPLLTQPPSLVEFTFGSGSPLRGYDRTGTGRRSTHSSTRSTWGQGSLAMPWAGSPSAPAICPHSGRPWPVSTG